MSGAPLGNKNAANAKRWRDAVLRALSRARGNIEAGLDGAATKLVALALDGDKWALDHLADRIDGKPAQVIAGDPDLPPARIEAILIRSIDATRDRSTEESS